MERRGRRGTPRDNGPALAARWSPEGRARTALKALRDPAVRAVVPLTAQQRDTLQQLATVALAKLDD